MLQILIKVQNTFDKTHYQEIYLPDNEIKSTFEAKNSFFREVKRSSSRIFNIHLLQLYISNQKLRKNTPDSGGPRPFCANSAEIFGNSEVKNHFCSLISKCQVHTVVVKNRN